MNTFGRFFRVTTFGESHGPVNGVVIDGLPGGLAISEKMIAAELERRRPGGDPVSTPRREPDAFQIVSGLAGGVTNGAPLTILIPNVAQNSRDYAGLTEIFRPGHGDYGWYARYGQPIGPGGGRLSGRETVARVAAGAVAKAILAESGMVVGGYTTQIGPFKGEAVDLDYVEQNPYRLADRRLTAPVAALIDELRQKGETIGGRLHLLAHNVPAGLGSPLFDKLEAKIGAAMLSIGAVKGILFGLGEAFADRTGSAVNDYQAADGTFLTNNSGGITGGLSNGAALEFDLLVRAAPSIGQPQSMLGQDGNLRELTLSGRHDCCLCPRVLVVAEAMLAIVLADEYLASSGLK